MVILESRRRDQMSVVLHCASEVIMLVAAVTPKLLSTALGSG